MKDRTATTLLRVGAAVDVLEAVLEHPKTLSVQVNDKGRFIATVWRDRGAEATARDLTEQPSLADALIRLAEKLIK
jgi:hypothetical protein